MFPKLKSEKLFDNPTRLLHIQNKEINYSLIINKKKLPFSALKELNKKKKIEE